MGVICFTGIDNQWRAAQQLLCEAIYLTRDGQEPPIPANLGGPKVPDENKRGCLVVALRGGHGYLMSLHRKEQRGSE